MITVHSYARFSTKKQEHGDSERRQTEMLNTFLASNPEYVLSELSLFDKGKSGWSGDKQKCLNEFMAILRAKDGRIKRGDILFVENLDRVSRKGIRPTQDTINEILNAGVSIAIAMPMSKIYRAEKTNDLGDAIELASFAYAASTYSENLSRRVKSFYRGARQQARESGRIINSGAPPAWLTRDKKKGFAIRPDVVEAVRYIFERTIAGVGGKVLTRELNEKFPCPSGRTKTWNERYMRYFLNSRQVLGEFQPHIQEGNERVPHGDPIPNYFPQIIDEKTFRLANAAAQHRRRERGPSKAFINLFTGLLWHAKDKCPVHLTTYWQTRTGYNPAKKTNRKVVFRRLKSFNHVQGVPGSSSETIDIVDFEHVVTNWLREMDLSVFNGSNSKAAELAALEATLAKKEARIAEIESDEETPVALLGKQLAKLNAESDELRNKVDALKTEAANSTAANGDHLKFLLGLPNTDENRQLLREAIKRVVRRISILPVKLGNLRRSPVGSMIEIEMAGCRRQIIQLGKQAPTAISFRGDQGVAMFDEDEAAIAKRQAGLKKFLLEWTPNLRMPKPKAKRKNVKAKAG